MKNKVIVIIGGTSGIGRAAVRHFLKTDHDLVILYRSKDKLEQTLYASNKKVTEILCDLYSFESMKKACESIRASFGHVDVLICNAGMWEFGNRQETLDGIETTFQVNVLAPVFFQKNLRDLLLNSEEPRVIITASALHTGTINFDDIEYKKSYSGFQAYRQSKLSVVLLTRLWAKNNSKIKFFSLHPGVVSTELGRSAGWFARSFFKWFGITPEKGATAIIHLVESPIDSLKSGEYYIKKSVSRTSTKASYDLLLAKKLEQKIEVYLDRVK